MICLAQKNEIVNFDFASDVLPMRMIGLCKSETVDLAFFNISSELCGCNTNHIRIIHYAKTIVSISLLHIAWRSVLLRRPPCDRQT